MANYTNERARYGGCAGQILVHSTPGQFQLPDLGSKVIIGGRGTGLYRNTTIERELAGAPITNRVGPQVEIVSNFGSRITSQFVGNMELDSSGPITMLGTPKYNLERSTSETQLNIENFQGHAHNSSQKFLNYTGQHSVATSGGKDSDQRLANSGAGNQLDFSEPWNRESIHKHNITRPTSYAQTFTYSHPTVQIDMSGVSASVDVDVEDDEKLDELVTPFMLVEYIIKF